MFSMPCQICSVKGKTILVLQSLRVRAIFFGAMSRWNFGLFFEADRQVGQEMAQLPYLIGTLLRKRSKVFIRRRHLCVRNPFGGWTIVLAYAQFLVIKKEWIWENRGFISSIEKFLLGLRKGLTPHLVINPHSVTYLSPTLNPTLVPSDRTLLFYNVKVTQEF